MANSSVSVFQGMDADALDSSSRTLSMWEVVTMIKQEYTFAFR